MIGIYLVRLTSGCYIFLTLGLVRIDSILFPVAAPYLEFELVSLLFLRVSEPVLRFAVLLFYRYYGFCFII